MPSSAKFPLNVHGLVLLGLLFLPALPGSAERPAARRPNVIVLLTDDQGYGDFSCLGNPVLKTPNTD